MKIKLINLIFMVMLGCVGYCIAENFLAEPAINIKKRSLSKVKQDLFEALASVLELECKTIEINAKTQQEICKRISELADNDKNSKIATAKSEQLQAGLEKLNLIKKDCEANLKKSYETLSFIQNGCIQNLKK